MHAYFSSEKKNSAWVDYYIHQALINCLLESSKLSETCPCDHLYSETTWSCPNNEDREAKGEPEDELLPDDYVGGRESSGIDAIQPFTGAWCHFASPELYTHSWGL